MNRLGAVRVAMQHASKARWREALEIATKWARRNVKHLREETIRRATAAVIRLMTPAPQGEEAGVSQAPEVRALQDRSAGPPSPKVRVMGTQEGVGAFLRS